MKIIFLTFLLVGYGCKEIKAADISRIASIGDHYPIFTFEKNENPQNVMVIYTKLDKDCRFELSTEKKNQPVFDFYWLMDKKNYKPVHAMIKYGIRKRLQMTVDESFKKNRDSFEVRLNDLKELKTDIKEVQMKVLAIKNKSSEKCEVAAEMKLGPSDHNETLKVSTIYSEAEKTLLPPFRKVVSVTLIGKNESSGQEMRKTYSK